MSPNGAIVRAKSKSVRIANREYAVELMRLSLPATSCQKPDDEVCISPLHGHPEFAWKNATLERIEWWVDQRSDASGSLRSENMCPAKSNSSKAQAETHIVDTQSKEASLNLTSESKQPSECAYRVSISMDDAGNKYILISLTAKDGKENPEDGLRPPVLESRASSIEPYSDGSDYEVEDDSSDADAAETDDDDQPERKDTISKDPEI